MAYSKEERLKIGQSLDWILPVNAVGKILFKKSIYEGESSKLGVWDAVDVAAVVPVFKGAKIIKAGANVGIISKLFGTVAKRGVKTGTKKAVTTGTKGATQTATKRFIPKYTLRTAGTVAAVGSGAYLGGKAVSGAGGAIDRYFETGSSIIPKTNGGYGGSGVVEQFPGFWSGLGALPSGIGQGIGGGAEGIGEGIGSDIVPLAVVGAVAYLIYDTTKSKAKRKVTK